MCGRAAQTLHAITLASSCMECKECITSMESNDSQKDNNFNLSPGNEVTVFQYDKKSNSIVSDKKIWGLLTKGGTEAYPLPFGASKHFSSMMFNARSETAYEKYSFRPLLSNGKSCVLAVDGFYEWKMLTKDVCGVSGKQPYFVHRSDMQPLLLAGFYTSVPTGTKPETLHTCTVLTTNSSPKLTWLHQRQPLFLWDIDLAKQWLRNPTQELLLHISSVARANTPPCVAWHPVTRKMSHVQYQGDDCIKRITLQKPVPTIQSFFTNTPSPRSLVSTNSLHSKSNNSSPRKRSNPYKKKDDSSPVKKNKGADSPRRRKDQLPKGTMESFFKKKT